MESKPLNSSPPAPPTAMASAIGQSAIERLPLEIIHDIHFLNPDNALLATSKTMAAKFTASVLPVVRTAGWVTHLLVRSYVYISQADVELVLKCGVAPRRRRADHVTFILSRAYTHSPRIIHTIMCNLIQTESLIRHDLRRRPPFDPSETLELGNQTLPIDLIHYLYHTYPTSALDMHQALRAALKREEWELATALIDCGGDPRSSPDRRFGNPKHEVGPKAQEIINNWTYKDIRTCSCGWTAKPVPFEDSEFAKQLCILRKNPNATINYKRVPPPSETRDNPLWTPGTHPSLKLWKLPPSQELGRNWSLPGEYLHNVDKALEEIFHPKRYTEKRRLFAARGEYEYTLRLWALFWEGQDLGLREAAFMERTLF